LIYFLINDHYGYGLFECTGFYFSIIEMLNASTRTVRGGSNPVFNSAMKQDDGLAINKKTVYAAEKPDKSGAHSIAALNRFICDSKNGATYSNNIKAAIGEKPDPVNPYIPHKYGKPLPDEKFTIKNQICPCLGKTPRRPENTTIGRTHEKFCGCSQAFIDHAPEILSYGPIALIVLILCAVLLISKIVICRLTGKVAEKTAKAVSNTQNMEGGVIDSDFESII
jgi:hypothetical protein